MNIGLILESVAVNTIVGSDTLAVREMFDNAILDGGSVFMETLDVFIDREILAIDESDTSITDKIKAKLKAVVSYVVSIYKYCTNVYKKFIDEVALSTDKYDEFVKKNKDNIVAGYRKLDAANADYATTKFSKITKENICKIIETKFGDIGVRLDIMSAAMDYKNITEDQKKALIESIETFTKKGVNTSTTKKIREIKLDDMFDILEKALDDRVNLHMMTNYLKTMHSNIESYGYQIVKKDGDDALAGYMTNIKFAASIVSKAMSQYLNLHVTKTTGAYKFLKHCAAAAGKNK